ncbi:hypothetical protein HYS48_00710 [Candidatus Woesearchaeota archaeon]|nr:hypothetical protein [Candidatus Woesearchaeota archaeon]
MILSGRIKYQEVYGTLSSIEWKRGKEIVDEIAKQRGVDRRQLILTSVYPHLRELVRERFAEERECRRLTEEERAARGGRGAHEYRLTEYGLRKRIEFHQRESAEGIEGILVPA